MHQRTKKFRATFTLHLNQLMQMSKGLCMCIFSLTHNHQVVSTTTSSLLLFNLLFLLLTKKFFLTQPWVVLFSNSGLDQSLENLCIRRRTCAVPRKVLFFCSSTLLIVPGIWASQPGNLSAVASTAPTTTGITIILTFCSYSSF